MLRFSFCLRAVLTPVLLVLGAPFLTAQETPGLFPDTRVGRIANLFFDAYNNPDTQAMERFLLEHRDQASLDRMPMVARMTQHEQMRTMAGDLAPHTIVEQEESSLAVLARSEKLGMWFRVGFELEAAAPYKLAKMAVAPAKGPDQTQKAFEDWDSLEDLLAGVCEETGIPSIAAAVISEDGIVQEAVWGVRVIGEPAKAVLTDPYHIGSVTKSVNGSLIGKLVEDGKLSWESTIGEVLSETDLREEYRDVTILELLQHRGGLHPYVDIAPEDEDRYRKLPGTNTDQRAAFAAKALSRESTGSRNMHYSNAGYVVAGLMAERATGRTWEDLVRDLVYAPLNMTRSGFGAPATVQHPDAPRGHLGEPPNLTPRELGTDAVGPFVAPAGDAYASLGDLCRYAVAHLQGLLGRDGFLEAETVRRLHTPPGDQVEGYAGGWVIQKGEDESLKHWHAGSAEAFFAHVELWPSQKLGVVVLMNSGAISNQQVADQIARALMKKARS